MNNHSTIDWLVFKKRWALVVRALRDNDKELTHFCCEVRSKFKTGDGDADHEGDNAFIAGCAANLEGVNMKMAAVMLVRAIVAPILTTDVERFIATGNRLDPWRSIGGTLAMFGRADQIKVAKYCKEKKVRLAVALRELGLRAVPVRRDRPAVRNDDLEGNRYVAEWIASEHNLNAVPERIRIWVERFAQDMKVLLKARNAARKAAVPIVRKPMRKAA